MGSLDLKFMLVTIYFMECVSIHVYAAWCKMKYHFVTVKLVIDMLQIGNLHLKVTFQGLITQ